MNKYFKIYTTVIKYKNMKIKNQFPITISIAVILFSFILLANPAQAAVLYGKGTLLKGEFAEVFLVSQDNILHWIPNEETFNALGYSWSSIVVVKNEVLWQYSFGEALGSVDVNLDSEKSAESGFETPAEIEIKVKEYFIDIPIMIDIAKCESGFRQFNDNGTVLKGSGLYIGVYQIDEKIHKDYAKELGMDIFSVEGNLAYARHLYNNLGPQPWPACSKKSVASNRLITSDLAFGDTSDEVKVLQQLLNQKGFIISESGPGSLGNETQYFGALTRLAVQKFQCSKNIVCQGDEATTGYGLVGSKTRAALQ